MIGLRMVDFCGLLMMRRVGGGEDTLREGTWKVGAESNVGHDGDEVEELHCCEFLLDVEIVFESVWF